MLTVFRLIPGGLLDPNFADKGVMHYATDTEAHAVVLDPSGAIVVAGSNAGRLMVLRLLANGTLDGSFGNGGSISVRPKTTRASTCSALGVAGTESAPLFRTDRRMESPLAVWSP